LVKINCDGAFHQNSASGGWGFVIRDSAGNVVCEGSGRLDHLLNSFHAEVIACIHGLKAAAELGIEQVILETDALMVQQAVSSSAYGLSFASEPVCELKHLVHSSFSSFESKYKPRDCNRVAHALAALGVECETETSPLLDELPTCIRELVVRHNGNGM
ncbi:hypothetical protein BAE44_0012710, partial [Dichanthelium oligosanthes]